MPAFSATPYLAGLSPARREIGWSKLIRREPRDVRVAVNADGDVVGFGSCGASRGEPEFHRRGLHPLRRARLAEPGDRPPAALGDVRRGWSRQGHGSAVIWVLRENPARFFYQRLGGKEVGRKHCLSAAQ